MPEEKCLLKILNNYVYKFKKDIKPFKTAVFAVFIAVTASFGVSVISSVGKQIISNEMNSMGLNGMTVSAYTSEGENATNTSLYNTLVSMNEISEISPVLCEAATAVFSNGISKDVVGWGINTDISNIISLKNIDGRMINNADLLNQSYVCVIDKNLAEKIYRRSNICGKKLVLNIGDKTAYFTVVGTVEKGSNILNTLSGDVIPDFIYIPYTTMSSISSKPAFDQIIFSSTDNGQTVSELKQKLVDKNSKYRSHTIKLTNLSNQKDQISNIVDTAFSALFFVSCTAVIVCSMAVGASVNTAVISKYKDIGIKISMGAGRWNITKEFLSTALMACITGISGGLTVMLVAVNVLQHVVSFGFSTDYSLILLSVFATIFLTIIFSVLPSYNAARMSPIKALNRE